ncbi:MAG: hypothetical protein KGS72_22620 [Cyanobacteria bacterium REEB67]|nr:hypothetical protein [Cyanobacteria bacterium REEB67]
MNVGKKALLAVNFSVLVQIFLCSHSCGNDAALATGTQPHAHTINGSVSLDPVTSLQRTNACLPQLNKFGLRCLGKAKSPLLALVTAVAPGSLGSRRGVLAGDNIIALKAEQERFTIIIDRDGKLYSLTLSTSDLGPVNSFVGQKPQYEPLLRQPLSGGAERHPFTALEIARDGHEGVIQRAHDNCWFEAAVGAVADSKEGPAAIANMITSIPDGYKVRFSASKVIEVHEADITVCRVADPAKWASILESAEVLSLGTNADPANGADTPNPGVKVGLEMLTGRPISFVRPEDLAVSNLVDLLKRFSAAGKPMTVASKSPQEHGLSFQPMTPNHAFNVVAFDSARNMVTLRNPLGIEIDDGNNLVQHIGADQIKVDIPTLRTFFRYLAYPE